MKYLQIIATGILVALCVIAFELRSLRPSPTTGDLGRAFATKDRATIDKFMKTIPITDVRSVSGSVSVGGTVDVNVKDWVEVRTDYKSPLRVEIER